jgi:hypothetical protein
MSKHSVIGVSEIHEALGGWDSINTVGCPLLSNAALHQHPATNVYTKVRTFSETLVAPALLRGCIRSMSNPEDSSATVEWHGTKKKSHVHGSAEVKGRQQAVNS